MTPSGFVPRHRTRRWFLRLGTALSSGLVARRSMALAADETPRVLGSSASAYGQPSRFEKLARYFRPDRANQSSVSWTPLQDLYGIITPASLHFERHHSGVPDIDPAEHRLLIHGLVDRPLIFTVEEIKRFPSVSHVYFLECSGNTNAGWRNTGVTDVQRAHGLMSCSEWTGVPLATLLREAGVKPEGTWIVAEGADACRMTRSLPMGKAMSDVLIAYGQNGEPIRPEQGFPLRLFVPGWEGIISIKWLRRIKVVDRPYMTREETSKYTDLMPDGLARQFTFAMDAKSVITRPSGGQTLSGPGFCDITGIAWSGRGAVRRVEVTTDGGQTWHDAELQGPVLPLAHTRFHLPWRWAGGEAILQSRCTDETGYVQPSRAELIKVRGLNSYYHYNGIQSWKVMPDGSVRHAED